MGSQPLDFNAPEGSAYITPVHLFGKFPFFYIFVWRRACVNRKRLVGTSTDLCIYIYIFDIILYVIFYESHVDATRYITIYFRYSNIFCSRDIIYNIIRVCMYVNAYEARSHIDHARPSVLDHTPRYALSSPETSDPATPNESLHHPNPPVVLRFTSNVDFQSRGPSCSETQKRD